MVRLSSHCFVLLIDARRVQPNEHETIHALNVFEGRIESRGLASFGEEPAASIAVISESYERPILASSVHQYLTNMQIDTLT